MEGVERDGVEWSKGAGAAAREEGEGEGGQGRGGEGLDSHPTTHGSLGVPLAGGVELNLRDVRPAAEHGKAGLLEASSH